ncbi:early estrogen-induced gene 1 protein-like isoform X1 [Tigriopus californicus]|uniref:early estrogen-induced gene 1 protein-like isoform X1 n=1 Tax=Tigriopus californicus TaxID=6832 RepID=UPI0027D9FB32|nr:early estrogen-induced gene 1 protein-like isoform X1 [Tigriopus californicus]XP_059093079.1 early estrogen-induced gene 1 protein-like isoform X1 [Tigriopus californicus]
MAFMLKKKRYKFQVDLCLEELSEVTYSKAIMFAKVRQLEGGSFIGTSKRMDVQNHRVRYDAKFDFPCKMSASASSGILDSCKCRVSIRLEEKGGRNFRKLGFSDINLAEYAGAGPCTQRYILQPYDQNHRLDNSILQISLNITLKEGDTIFQRPLTRQQPISLPGEDRLSGSSLNLANIPPSSSSGPAIQGSQATTSVSGSQLSVPGPSAQSGTRDPVRKVAGIVAATDLVKNASGCSLGSSGQDTPPPSLSLGSLGVVPSLGSSSGSSSGVQTGSSNLPEGGQSHTRNSSTTSQTSAGYASQVSGGQPTHSRQSSSGDSTHGRAHRQSMAFVQSPPTTFLSLLRHKTRSSSDLESHYHSQPSQSWQTTLLKDKLHLVRSDPSPTLLRQQMSSPGQLSSLGSPTGSMASGYVQWKRRPRLEHSSSVRTPHVDPRPLRLHRRSVSDFDWHLRNLSQGSSDTGFFGSMEKEKRRKQKLDEGRRDPESVINELMEGVDFDKATKEDAETTGLQLYVCKDGTVTFDKNSTSRRDIKPVVIHSEPH